jgi:2Fe-2S ferredoxin
MPHITYIQPDGTTVTIDVQAGMSLMRAAVEHDVVGIRAECGGAAACATCQIVVTGAAAQILPAPEAMEASMLDEEDRAAGRRLSCQISASDAMDGIMVQVLGTV